MAKYPVKEPDLLERMEAIEDGKTDPLLKWQEEKEKWEKQHNINNFEDKKTLQLEEFNAYAEQERMLREIAQDMRDYKMLISVNEEEQRRYNTDTFVIQSDMWNIIKLKVETYEHMRRQGLFDVEI